MLEIFLLGWVELAIFFAVLWKFSLWASRPQLVDLGWSLSLCYLALLYSLSQKEIASRQILVGILPLFAFGKLALLLFYRLLQGEIDSRYRYLDQIWQQGRKWKYFLFFQFQAAAASLISIPWLLAANKGSGPLTALETFSVALFTISFLLETSADWSLKQFKEEKKVKSEVCKKGLWAYSRHPNYFFQSLIWWSFGLFALEADYGYFALISPLIMLYLILFVTGIPPNEQRQLETKGEAYRSYQKTTSSFIPWFPKSS